MFLFICYCTTVNQFTILEYLFFMNQPFYKIQCYSRVPTSGKMSGKFKKSSRRLEMSGKFEKSRILKKNVREIRYFPICQGNVREICWVWSPRRKIKKLLIVLFIYLWNLKSNDWPYWPLLYLILNVTENKCWPMFIKISVSHFV